MKNKPYTDQPRKPTGLMTRSHAAAKKRKAKQGKSVPERIVDTAGEVVDALKRGMAGSARMSRNPASEGSRARNRMEERATMPSGRAMSDRDVEAMRRASGKAYGGKAKKKMMCGGKAKK